MRRLLVPLVAAALLGLPAVATANDNCAQAVRDVRGTQPTKAQIETALNAAAQAHAVPKPVLRAIAYVESEWRQYYADGSPVLSSDSVCGVGIMQVTAGTYAPADQVRLASDYEYNIGEGARILAEKWAVSATTPPPAGAAPDDPLVIENWFYAICLYNGCGSDPAYPTKVANVVHDPFRYAPNFGLKPYFFTKPQDADPTYVFPAAFQARHSSSEELFVFYDHTTGAVTKTVPAPTHDLAADPMPPTGYGGATYGPDGPGVTCEQCGGWRLANGAGLLRRAHWTNSVTGPAQSTMTWRPMLTGLGRYRVRAYVPAIGTDTLGTATYSVGGTPVTIGQNAAKNAWRALGDHTLAPGETVVLGDHSTVGGQKLVGDALRVTAVPTMHLNRGATTVTYGSATTLTFKMTHAGAAYGGPDLRATLYKRPVGGAWSAVASYQLTGTDQQVTVRPAATTDYQMKLTSTDLYYEDAVSAVRRVSVRPRVSAVFANRVVPAGSAATLSVAVSPNHRGQRVYLQRFAGGTWQTVTSAVLSTESRARFTISKARGTYYYRAYKRADADHTAATSSTAKLTVY